MNNPKKMQLKRWITIGLILIVIGFLLLAFLFINKYISRVIISQPFRVEIQGISTSNANAIKIFGYSPTGKIQLLNNVRESDCWEYFDYSNFTSLLISKPNSLTIAEKIVITTKNHQFEIVGFKKTTSNKNLDLTEFIKGRISKTEIICSMFHWKEVRYALIITITLISFLILFLFFRKKTKLKNPNKILWSIYGSAMTMHISFIILTGKYLITSGIVFIISMGLLFRLILNIYEIIRKSTVKLEGLRLSIISVSIFLCLIEIIFILMGYKSTYSEQVDHYYYTSPYKPENSGWLHVRKNNHDLITDEYSYHRTINYEGLSDIEHEIIKKANEYRILGLGDSFTEGDGTDADSTWLKFLERNFAKYPLHKNLTYINAGVCGSDPYFEYFLLTDKLLKYKPDLVVLAVNNSDISDIILRGGMERFQPDGTLKYNSAPWWEPIYATIHISRLVFSAVGYNSILVKEDNAEYSKAKEKIAEVLCRFKTLSEKEHFKLIVVFHPVKSEINSNNLELKSVISKVSENNSIDVLNMLDYFIKIEKINAANSKEYYWKKDGHHNAKGYAAFARGVEWKLKESGILDSLFRK